jgi:integrase
MCSRAAPLMLPREPHMPTVKITQALAESAKLSAGQTEVTYWDASLKGFILRLRRAADGSVNKAWHAYYRIGRDQQRKPKIGDAGVNAMPAAKAREIANDMLADARRGIDVVAIERVAKERTPGELGPAFERYLEYAQGRLRPRSLVEVRRHLLRDWAPVKHIAVRDLSRVDINARLSALVSVGSAAANRARASLSSFYSWAIREGLCDHNPVIAARRPEPETPRSRVLSDAELVMIWNTCHGVFGQVLRLLILTGQRRQEVGAITAQEVDLDRRTWTLPASRTKNHLQHVVPLSDQALAILWPAIADKPQGCLFGLNGFGGWSGSRATLDKRLQTMAPWVLHDLRRTVTTRMADLGVQPHIIEALLNHVSGHRAGVAGIYNRSSYAAEKRQALDMWGAHVDALVAGETGANIVPLRAAT